jgi:hypothetical protein
MTLEDEKDNELKVFSIFYNQKEGKYRVAQADLVMVDNIAVHSTFSEAISAIINSAKQAGEKISITDIKII